MVCYSQHCKDNGPLLEIGHEVPGAVGVLCESIAGTHVEQGWRGDDCTRLPPTWPGIGPPVG